MKGSASWPKALAEAPLPQSKSFFCLPLKDFVETYKNSYDCSSLYWRNNKKISNFSSKVHEKQHLYHPNKNQTRAPLYFCKKLLLKGVPKKRKWHWNCVLQAHPYIYFLAHVWRDLKSNTEIHELFQKWTSPLLYQGEGLEKCRSTLWT